MTLEYSQESSFDNIQLHISCGKFRSSDLGTAQEPQEQCCPFLPVVSCVQTMLWLSAVGIFNVRT